MILRTAPATIFLAVTEVEPALAFYRDALGLEFVTDDPFALVFKGPGYELRLSKVPEFTPLPFTILDWQVDDIRASIKTLADKGVERATFTGIEVDADGVWTSPDGGAQIFWFKDPDANVLSISQRS